MNAFLDLEAISDAPSIHFLQGRCDVMQTQMGEMAGCKMESCDAEHMTMLSVPERVPHMRAESLS